MVKDKIFNRYIFLTLLLACISVVYPIDSPRERVLKAFQEKVGVKELTGKNDGKEIEYFLKLVNLRKGDQWCAAFVYTCFYEAGVTGVPKSGYSPSWFPKAKTIYTKGESANKTPLPGDVIGIYIPEKGRIGHVGFNEDWPSSSAYCVTVEGNTSMQTNAGKNDYNGQGVERKRRLKRQINKISRWL